MRTRHVVFHYPASGWRTGVAPVHQPGVEDHVRYLQSLDSSGAIVMAGPFMDTDCGGMLVLHEQDREGRGDRDRDSRSGCRKRADPVRGSYLARDIRIHASARRHDGDRNFIVFVVNHELSSLVLRS